MKKRLAILLLLLLVVAVGIQVAIVSYSGPLLDIQGGWLDPINDKMAEYVENFKRESEIAAVAALEKLGANISKDDGNVTYVSLDDESEITDADLVHLEWLPKLTYLFMATLGAGENKTITDEGLVHLKGLTNLEELTLSSQFTDAGLVHLQGLTSLKRLSLSKTQVTDAGLVHLKGLTKLDILFLNGTQITDAGVADLQKALPKCRIID